MKPGAFYVYFMGEDGWLSESGRVMSLQNAMTFGSRQRAIDAGMLAARGRQWTVFQCIPTMGGKA